MARYLVARSFQAVFVVFGVTCVTFIVLRLVPGDPSRVLLPQGAPPAAIARLRRDLGLDETLLTQFVNFLRDVATGSLGTSFRSDLPVLDMVLDALPNTLLLAVVALLVSCLIAVPLGVLSAGRTGGLLDRVILVFVLIAQSIPPFWLGVLLVYWLAVQTGVLPALGNESPSNYVLPVSTLAIGLIPAQIRTVRQGMLEALSEDYVRTARAKGVSERGVLFVHALPNASLPLVTVVGLQFGLVLGGAVVVELIFNWPGVGLLALQSIQSRDFPVVQGVVVLAAVAYVSVNLLVDFVYAALNPRVRRGMQA